MDHALIRTAHRGPAPAVAGRKEHQVRTTSPTPIIIPRTPALMKAHPHLCFLEKALTPAPLPIVGEGKRERGLHRRERIRGEGGSSSEREKGFMIEEQ